MRVARHLEDRNDEQDWTPPMVQTRLQPTRGTWLRHQLTLTPHQPWRRHCNSARAARDHHQRADERATLGPDTGRSVEGLAKTSMDYMYMRDRVGKYSENTVNPLYLGAIEHRHGRVLAYQTPNKGFNEEASWLPHGINQSSGQQQFQRGKTTIEHLSRNRHDQITTCNATHEANGSHTSQ